MCIHDATSAPCSTCHLWYCKDHIENHDCAQVEVWHAESSFLNELKPDEFEIERIDATTKVTLKPKDRPKKPDEIDWRQMIER